MDRIRRMWVRLGGLRLFLSLYFFHTTRRGAPKVAFLLRYYTIAAGKKFRGKILKVPYTLEPGWILEVRNGADDTPVWYHFRSLYEFVRSFDHACSSEESAQANVEVSVDVALEIVRDLLAFWPLTSTQRQRLTRKLADLRGRFALARRPPLCQAREHIEGVAGFRDRLRRPNPSASAARVSAAERRYQVRLREITSIVPNLNRLHIVAHQELHRIHRVLLERDLTILTQMRSALVRVSQEAHINWIVRCLRQIRDDLATIHVAPFYRNARYMEAEIGKALGILFDRNKTPAQRAKAIEGIVATMIASIAFKRAQRALEELVRELSMRLRARKLRQDEQGALAARVEAYARQAKRLKEDSFKRKRLEAFQAKLTRAAELLRQGDAQEAKACLKEASAMF